MSGWCRHREWETNADVEKGRWVESRRDAQAIYIKMSEPVCPGSQYGRFVETSVPRLLLEPLALEPPMPPEEVFRIVCDDMRRILEEEE